MKDSTLVEICRGMTKNALNGLKAEILAELKEAGVIPQSDKKTTGK